jgi:hypothetical protein
MSTRQEIKNEFEKTKCVVKINNDSAIQAPDDHGIEVILIERLGSITGLFRLKLLKYVSVSTTITRSSAMTVDGFRAFYHPETVLLLHTSGTSVKKKLVPYSLNMVVIQQCLPIQSIDSLYQLIIIDGKKKLVIRPINGKYSNGS